MECKEWIIKNPAMNGGVCCFGKEFGSEFNTSLTALKGGVLNPSRTINNGEKIFQNIFE